jgi:4,5-dihydroxyphthalate decarboxylase
MTAPANDNPVRIALGGTPLCALVLGMLEPDPAIDIDRNDVRPIHRAFRPMVMEQAFDVSELAIVTALQAIDYCKPIIALPVTVAARFQHKCIVQNANFTDLEPKDLIGQRVAVRAFSQTTGAWVRTILEREFDVPSDSITWITQEPPHVAEAKEPPNVVRDPDGAGPAELLERGDVAAAIFGNDMPTENWVRPVIPDPDTVARASFERSGIVPINHVVAVTRAFAERRPNLVRKIYRTFGAMRADAFGESQLALHPFGYDAMRPSVEALLQYAASQKLTSRQLAYDEIFGEAMEIIGSS